MDVLKRRAYIREYNQRPEVKARKRLYTQRPDVKARLKAYWQRPEIKAKYNELRKNNKTMHSNSNKVIDRILGRINNLERKGFTKEQILEQKLKFLQSIIENEARL